MCLCVQLLGQDSRCRRSVHCSFCSWQQNVVVLATALNCYACRDCPEPWDEKHHSVFKCTSATDPFKENDDDDDDDGPHYVFQNFPGYPEFPNFPLPGFPGSVTDDMACIKFVGNVTWGNKTTSGMVCFCTSM